ncbi:hypothetical protein NEOLEDRAFT_1126752 [Neolentinus lepideus HHB14362 ss-1]|uniref:Uncharacterized protein n=1 Tax=Neolentinus lepideus HHB14362 ss-1 TaxID=1314782 RepID=A0A165VQA1_9AGAM|nr:hypothetical protein NEOLEDRAFT_1126752 [Neolentinus lepideus HHB14362 ss-1]
MEVGSYRRSVGNFSDPHHTLINRNQNTLQCFAPVIKKDDAQAAFDTPAFDMALRKFVSPNLRVFPLLCNPLYDLVRIESSR